jgi:hypothetical protein
MNNNRLIQFLVAVALLAKASAFAQAPATDTPTALKLDPPPARSLNRFGLSYRMGFNVPVNFKNLGGYPALNASRLTVDGDRYNYDNGYVLTDSSGNAMGYTRYWGYDSASQVSGNDSIVMQRSSSAATVSSGDHYDAPISGVEVTYNRELLAQKSWRGGLEGAFGYSYLSVHDSGTRSASVTRVNDTYAFPGTTVPPAGYTGRKDVTIGSGSVVGASPTASRTDTDQTATITGSRDFSADLFNFRVGPYVEIPLSKSISFTLSGGFALMFVSSEFRYNETVTIPGVGSVQHQASGAGTGWLPGGYVAGNFSIALSDAWSFVAGAQFEDVGRYTQTLGGKQATLDLSRAIFVTVGLSYSF